MREYIVIATKYLHGDTIVSRICIIFEFIFFTKHNWCDICNLKTVAENKPLFIIYIWYSIPDSLAGYQFIAKTRRFHWIVSALLSRNNFNNKTDNTMKKYKYRSIGIVPKSNKKTSRIRYP
jgi:hypothetical protein